MRPTSVSLVRLTRMLARALCCGLLAWPLVHPATAVGQSVVAERHALNVTSQSSEIANPLQRPVTLDAASMRLGDVLAEISAQADFALIYGNDLVPVDQKIEVHFRATPAGVALRSALSNTDVDYQVTGNQQVVLVKRAKPRAATRLARQAVNNGSVVGRITDATTGEPIAAADVWLEGTSARTITTADGRFLLNNIKPGTYTLRVRRIGYAATSQTITVQSGQTVTMDFNLQTAPTQLDAVVATVTGEQRIRELGHVVGRIAVDSLVREAPVYTLSEILTARVPGLQVFQTSGTVGGEIAIRVRSASSLELTPEPIIIVDGIRYTGVSPYGYLTTEGSSAAGPFNVEPTSRLNDINPNDIESIEVVKGPSAATLYGTDAANGVIVITTKRGRPGPAQWNAYMRAGYSEVPNYKHPESYWGWGHSNPRTNCTLRLAMNGTCTQDSVTIVHNPLNEKETTIFGPKPQWEYGASVSGGVDQFRYFFSADFADATGPLRLPPYMIEQVQERLGGNKPPETQLEPNKQQRINLRSNITAHLSNRAVATVHVGFTQNSTRQISFVNPFVMALNNLRPTEEFDHAMEAFARSSTETVYRFSGSASLNWRPFDWLSTRATIGMDVPAAYRYSLAKRDAWEGHTGTVEEDRNRAITKSGDLGATLSFNFLDGLVTSRTSMGAQYTHQYNNRVVSRGTNLRPGGTSLNDAGSKDVLRQHYNESVTLGSYFEQMVGLRDRVFLTAAVRADGSSNFGNEYRSALYPKAGISWVLSEEPFIPQLPGLDELRVRYAFGASGQQPRPDMTRANFNSSDALVDGETLTRVYVTRFASADLRPERVREHEFGMDASAFSGRLNLELTWNYRQITDQIRQISLPSAFGSAWANIGYSTGNGFEASVRARVIDNPMLTWDLNFSHATNDTKVIRLGDVPPTYTYFGGMVEGFPLGARFMRPLLGYEDKNGDGIIAADEIIMGDTAVYMGRGTPAWTQTITGVIGLFNQKVRLSALLDRRGDFSQYNLLAGRHRNSGLMRGAVDPTAPLEEQARVMASWAGRPPIGDGVTTYIFLDEGDYTRLREVSLSLAMPDSWASALKARSARMSIAARNLGLWTKVKYGDPESMRMRGNFGGFADNIPQARNWVIRMDVGF